MKIVELITGFTVPLTNEEADLLIKFHKDQDSLSRRSLNEREIQLANNMVIKDVLYRKNQDGHITYHKKTI